MRVENQTKTRVWENSSLCPEISTKNAVQAFHPYLTRKENIYQYKTPISRSFYCKNFKEENLPGLLRLIKEPEDVIEPETDVDPGGVEEGLHHHSQDHQGPGEGGHACFFCLLPKLLRTCMWE